MDMGATVMPPSIPHVAATVMSRERSNPAVSGRPPRSVGDCRSSIGVGVGVLTDAALGVLAGRAATGAIFVAAG